MGRRIAQSLPLGAVLLAVCTAVLMAREAVDGRIEAVDAREQVSMYGGQQLNDNYCLKTVTSCSGTSACSLKGLQCIECRQNVPSYKECREILLPGYKCGQGFMNPGVFCGTTYFGAPVDGECPTCATQSSACGTQMPNVIATGSINCP
jgi:hypothetical protein